MKRVIRRTVMIMLAGFSVIMFSPAVLAVDMESSMRAALGNSASLAAARQRLRHRAMSEGRRRGMAGRRPTAAGAGRAGEGGAERGDRGRTTTRPVYESGKDEYRPLMRSLGTRICLNRI